MNFVPLSACSLMLQVGTRSVFTLQMVRESEAIRGMLTSLIWLDCEFRMRHSQYSAHVETSQYLQTTHYIQTTVLSPQNNGQV